MIPTCGGHKWIRSNVLGLVAIFIALNVTAVAAQVADRGAGKPGVAEAEASKKKKKKRIRGPAGPQGPVGPQGPPGPEGVATGGPPSGPAGGALAGSYPNPTLDVSGGPCPNGQELVNVSAAAALTCSAGVYSDGNNNVAAGPSSFPFLTSGLFNSALGDGALLLNTSGHSNSAFGESALPNGTGIFNTAVGRLALGANATGSDNTAVGGFALRFNFTGNANTSVGNSSLTNATGDNNVALGNFAGNNLTAGDHNVDIANGGVAGESNTIRIGTDGGQTRAFIAGIRGQVTGVADAVPVVIDSAGQLGTVSSSRRAKTGIEPLGALADPLMDLKPVSFRYREGPDELHYGLIAEQVEKVMPTLVAYGADGLPETVQYQELPPLLLAKVQDQQRLIEAQGREARAQSELIAELAARVERLEARGR
jgi:hypothetical protein